MALNGLNVITDKILADAQAEADRIIETAQEECDRIDEAYRAKAEKIRAELSERARQTGAEWVTRAKASVAGQKRNRSLAVQSELLNAVFDDTLEEMRNLSTEKYTALLAGLLAAAMLEQVETEHLSVTYGDEDFTAPTSYEILMNARDMERCGKAVLEETRRKLNGKIDADRLSKMCLGSVPVNIGGGLILRCGNIEANCSLELLFAHLREELEAEVGHALFDVRTSFI